MVVTPFLIKILALVLLISSKWPSHLRAWWDDLKIVTGVILLNVSVFVCGGGLNISQTGARFWSDDWKAENGGI